MENSKHNKKNKNGKKKNIVPRKKANIGLDFNIGIEIKNKSITQQEQSLFNNTSKDIHKKFDDTKTLVNSTLDFDHTFNDYFNKIIKEEVKTHTWLEKYRPYDLYNNANYINNKEVIDEWISFFYDINTNNSKKFKKTDKPYLVLHGPPGTGKTTLAHALYKHFNYDIIEINSSECRNGKELKEYLNTSYMSVISDKETNEQRGIGIIMDEIDGISNNECSGINTLLSYTFLEELPNKKNPKPNVRFPLIATCNSVVENKLKNLLKHAHVLEINKVNFDNVENTVRKISKNEGLNLDNSNIFKLCSLFKEDYRQVIKYLETIHYKKIILDRYININYIKINENTKYNKQTLDEERLDYIFNKFIKLDLLYKELVDYNLDINDSITNIINRIIHSNNILQFTTNEKNNLDNYFKQFQELEDYIGLNILHKLCSNTQLELNKETINCILEKRKSYIITFIESDFLQVYYIIYENWEVILNNLLNSILKLSQRKLDAFVNHKQLYETTKYFMNNITYKDWKTKINYLDSFMCIHNVFKNIYKAIHKIINRIENTQNWNIKNRDLFDFKYQISDIFTIILTYNQLYFILDDISGSGINKLYKQQVLNHYCTLNTHKQNLGYFNNNLLFNINIKEGSNTNSQKPTNTKQTKQTKQTKLKNNINNNKSKSSMGFMSFEEEANMKCVDFTEFFKSIKKKNYTDKIIDINKFILHQDLDYFNYLYINNFQNIKKQKSYQNIYSKLKSTFIDFI
jgi:DNA polymerase III delta prime subunit